MSDGIQGAAQGFRKIDPELLDFDLGGLQVGLSRDPVDMDAILRLRAARFRGASGGSDMDRFDPLCHHLLIRKHADRAAVATARLRLLQTPEEVMTSYSAQFYDLGALALSELRCMEIGRICIEEGYEHSPDILRALLAGLTRIATAGGVDLLTGCASFPGADAGRHAAALAYLAANHVGPVKLRPGRGKGPCVDLQRGAATSPSALKQVPALLRMYLGMGGWVSDHAVPDPDLDTLLVFTAVETGAIPHARMRVLLALAKGRT